MDKHTEQKIGVVGGGLMGHGIAYLFAAVGHHVSVFEPFPDVRNSLPQRLRAIVELLGEDPRLLTRIAAHDSLDSAMRGADWVFEAAPEKLPLKQQIFAAIEKLVAPTTILASNSSAIPSTEIGRHLTHRERMVGTHFWNPPHLVPLVEVIQNEKTGSDVVERTMQLLHRAGKVPVHVRRDIPGFVGVVHFPYCTFSKRCCSAPSMLVCSTVKACIGRAAVAFVCRRCERLQCRGEGRQATIDGQSVVSYLHGSIMLKRLEEDGAADSGAAKPASAESTGEGLPKTTWSASRPPSASWRRSAAT